MKKKKKNDIFPKFIYLEMFLINTQISNILLFNNKYITNGYRDLQNAMM